MSLDPNSMRRVADQLERLSKSFAAGYHGLSNAGRTGVGALANQSLDPVLRSITLEESDFLLTKDIPTLKATQSTYEYTLKTAVGVENDLAGYESFLPQEGQAQYMRVVEVLKVYGTRTSITQMADLINSAGGYMADLEKENDQNAALRMAEAMERDGYVGGDYFMGSTGSVDPLAAASANNGLRQVRGIQANIREGDSSQRGIPGDFVGFGNSRSVVFDRKGGTIDRTFLDKVVTAIRDNRGSVKEAHCTTSQLAEFRATFFPIERADISSSYAIGGPGITNDEHAKVSVQTVGGTLDFIPNVFKYMLQRAIPTQGSNAAAPASPSVSVAMGGAATGSGFKAGEVYRYKVQAVSINGRSVATTTSTQTVGAGQDNYPIDLTITNVTGAEYYKVFRTPVESSGVTGTEMFIGNILPAFGGSTVFRDNGKIVPGLDSIVLMPKDKNRAKLAHIGNLLNKLQLGVTGTAFQHCYASYWAMILERPRSFGLIDNVYQVREGV